MGDGLLGHIAKGPIHKKVDALVNDPTGGFAKRVQFLHDLNLINPTSANASTDYRHLLETQAGITTAETAYLRDTWYNTGPNGWWTQAQPIYPTLHYGLVKALNEAGPNLLLDSYWMPLLPQGGPPVVEVIILGSASQVTRIIVTPRSPAPMQPRHTPASEWVVVPQADPREVPGYSNGVDQIVRTLQGKIVTWQRLEFP